MMQTLKLKDSFIEAVKDQKDGFHFGEIWRLNENVLGAIVPILRSLSSDERSYKMIEEVDEKEVYTIEDTGSIDKIKIKVRGNDPVFIRSGNIFKGKGTQSRVSSISVIIVPEKREEKEVIIPARCIHASHPISDGAEFRRYGYAPREVHASLMSGRGQSSVWRDVDRSSARLCMFAYGGPSSRGMAAVGGLSDNLVNNIEKIKKGKKKVSDIIKKVPCLKNQVGIVIFDSNGIVSVECFDHPASWRAFHENIIESYEDILSKEQPESLFELKKSVVPKKIAEFLDRFKGGKDERVFGGEHAGTYLLKTENLIGEYTILKDSIIHFIGLRDDQPHEDLEPIRGLGLNTPGSWNLPYSGGHRYNSNLHFSVTN